MSANNSVADDCSSTSSVDQLVAEKEITIKKLKTLAVKYKKEIAQLQTTVDSQQHSNEQLEADLNSSNAVLAAVKDELSQCHEQFSALTEENDVLKQSNGELSTLVETKNEMVLQLTSEIDRLQAKQTEDQTELQSVTEQLNELKLNWEKRLNEEKQSSSTSSQPIIDTTDVVCSRCEEFAERLSRVYTGLVDNDGAGDVEQQLQFIEAEIGRFRRICQQSFVDQHTQTEEEENEDEKDVSTELTARLRSENERYCVEMSTLKDQLNDLEKSAAEKSRQVVALSEELDNLRDRLSSVQSEDDSVRRQLSETQDQFSCKQAELTSEVTLLKSEIETKNVKISELQTEIDRLEKRLNLGDRELLDFEETIKSINNQLVAKNAEINSLKMEVNSLKESMASGDERVFEAEKQKQMAEDKATKIKQLLVRSKKEVAEEKKRVLELEQAVETRTVESEKAVQDLEQTKVQLSDLVAEKSGIESRLIAVTESSRRTVGALENSLATLKSELELSRQEMSSLRAEYDSYKIRVQSVLRQRSDDSLVVKHSKEMDELRRSHDEAVRTLQREIDEAVSGSRILQLEKDQLQTEIDRGKLAIEKLERQLDSQQLIWQEKLDAIAQGHQHTVRQQAETIQHLNEQNKLLSERYGQETSALREQYTTTRESLEAALAQLRQERESRSRHSAATSPYSLAARVADSASTSTGFDPLTVHREQGEGMEMPKKDSSLLTIADTSRDSTTEENFVPLEKLLGPVTSRSDSAEISMPMSPTGSVASRSAGANTQVAVLQQRIETLTYLLRESESAVENFEAQARILKDEIRRHERNEQRTNSVTNMEYLKNVVLKFLTMEAGKKILKKARDRNIFSVLQTMLRLSDEELCQLQDIVAADDDNNDNNDEGSGRRQKSAGWTSYFPRFSGVS